jgi:hypothetical protein
LLAGAGREGTKGGADSDVGDGVEGVEEDEIVAGNVDSAVAARTSLEMSLTGKYRAQDL